MLGSPVRVSVRVSVRVKVRVREVTGSEGRRVGGLLCRFKTWQL